MWAVVGDFVGDFVKATCACVRFVVVIVVWVLWDVVGVVWPLPFGLASGLLNTIK